MDNDDKKVLEAIKDIMISECQKHTYDFSDKKEFDAYFLAYLEEFAKHVLKQLDNGYLEPNSVPFLVKVIGKENREFTIMYHKDSDDKFVYRIIEKSAVININIDTICPQLEMDKLSSSVLNNAFFFEKHITEMEEDKIIDYEITVKKLTKILDPILRKYMYTLADRNNCYQILTDFGQTISIALREGELSIEEIPYIKVTMGMIENGDYYIIFAKNSNKFQIKKWNEYIPNKVLPFDIRIN